MPGFIGLPEIALLVVLAMLLFGVNRLPEIGRSLGRGAREFKDAVSHADPRKSERKLDR